MAAKITSASLSNYYGNPTGSFTVNGDNVYISYNLTPDEANALMALLFSFVEKRKAGLAEAVQNLETPPLLATAKHDIEGAF